MPAKKKIAEDKEVPVAKRPSLVEEYRRELSVGRVSVREGWETKFGAESFALAPAYEPPDLEFIWGPNPVGADPLMRQEFNRLTKEEGFVLLREEHVADSVEEAKETGRFAFKIQLDSMEEVGGGVLGLRDAGYVGLWRPKEVGERIRRARIEAQLRAMRASQHEGVELDVAERRKPIDELLDES